MEHSLTMKIIGAIFLLILLIASVTIAILYEEEEGKVSDAHYKTNAKIRGAAFLIFVIVYTILIHWILNLEDKYQKNKAHPIDTHSHSHSSISSITNLN